MEKKRSPPVKALLTILCRGGELTPLPSQDPEPLRRVLRWILKSSRSIKSIRNNPFICQNLKRIPITHKPWNIIILSDSLRPFTQTVEK